MIDSFVLFTDQKEIINKLSDEQAGKMFKAIFEYATSGETSKEIKGDLVMDIVFTTLKQTIDRNNEKWQETKQRRSEAGKKGAEKRWGAIANDSNAITSDSKNSNAINEMAKMAVSVSDSVSVPVNVPVSDSVSVNDNVSVSNSVSVNKNKNLEKEKDKEKESVNEYVDVYSRECPNLPHIKTVTDSRKKAIGLFKKTYTLKDWEEVCRIANSCDFLLRGKR